MKIEERLNILEGITYSEWQKIKLVIDNRFAEIKLKRYPKTVKNYFLKLKHDRRKINEEEGDKCMEEGNKQNGPSWFALGFSIATLIAVLFK